MSELDKVLDTVMDLKSNLIQQEAPDQDKEEFITALREQKKQEIVKEIREEYKQEIIKAANIEIMKETHRQKLQEIKSLMWNGFVLAFIVGLAVNQVTELLGFWKGTISAGSLKMTVLFTIVLLLICLAAYGFSFIAKAISLFDEFKKDNKDNKENKDNK